MNTSPIQTTINWGWLFSRFAGLWGSTENWSQQQACIWGCRQNEKNNPVKFRELINVFKRLNFTWIDQQGNIQSLKSSMVEDVVQFAMEFLKTMIQSWELITVVISYEYYMIIHNVCFLWEEMHIYNIHLKNVISFLLFNLQT